MRLMLNRSTGRPGNVRGTRRGGFGAYGAIWSVDEATTRLGNVGGKAKALHYQIMGSSADAKFKYAWNQWYLDFDGYSAAFKDSPKLFMLQHLTVMEDEIQRYEADIGLWQQQLAILTKKPVLGPTVAQTEQGREEIDQRESIWSSPNVTGAGDAAAGALERTTDAFDKVARALPWLVGALAMGAAVVYLGPPTIQALRGLLAKRRSR